MPVEQLVPPGNLDQHATLLALTPALLAAGAAMAMVTIGNGRGARVVGWIGLGVALSVQALFLIPNGAGSAYREPLFHGLVRIGWGPDLLALAMAGWAAWRWRPDAASVRSWPWCARVCLALLLPVVLLPTVVVGCEPDQIALADDSRPEHLLRQQRWRLARFAVVMLATALILLIGPPAATAATLAFAAATGRGPWRWWLAAGAVVAMLP